LWASTVIGRNHTPAVLQMGAAWMAHCDLLTYQDQLSLPVLLDDYGLTVAPIPGWLIGNPWFGWMGTTVATDPAEMQAFAEEYATWLGIWSDIQQHLPELRDTAARYPGARVLELGVRWATSTAALLAGAAAADGHVWSVDIAQPTYPQWWLESGRWTLTVGDDCDPAIADRQPPQVDVLFIDTNHVYRHTLAELRLYVPRVTPGGVVLCHDTELEAVPDGGDRPEPYPASRALDTFCAETGLAWVNRSGCYGLGVIQIPGEREVPA
jgi:predicted O-methyltransferase YrrM